jgi:hypothetical protein
MGRVVNATPRPLYPRERHGTHSIGGWVGPRAGMDGCGKSRRHRDSIPGPPNPSRVAIPTELSRSIGWMETSILQELDTFFFRTRFVFRTVCSRPLAIRPDVTLILARVVCQAAVCLPSCAPGLVLLQKNRQKSDRVYKSLKVERSYLNGNWM